MAPHPGIDTESLKDKARKELLNLLEGVCKACPLTCLTSSKAKKNVGTGQKAPSHRTVSGRPNWTLRQILDTTRPWD